MHGATVETTREAFCDLARGADSDARVPVVAHLRADPFEAYRRARGGAPAFFFETSGGREGWGYFGVEPDGFSEVHGSGALDALEDCLAGESLVRGDCEVPYPGGLFGWLSYDVVRDLERLPETTEDDRGLPGLQLGRYPCVAAWREPHEGETTLYLAASPRLGGDGGGGADPGGADPGGADPGGADPGAVDPDEAYDRGLATLESLAEAISTGDPAVGPPPVTADSVEFVSGCDRATYADRVAQVKRYIRAGDTFQANISHRLAAPAAVHPVETFAALRRVNPAPYSGLLEFPGVDLVSASPELLVERVGDRLETEPIAGTRPRGATREADRRLAEELTSDEKERAEHAMLVDLERNDLGKVGEYGSVTVDEYRRVDRYSEVMHLVSRVTGTMRPEFGLRDAVAAVFPGGTITGAPKPRTMEIIDEVEGRRRGPYTGSMAAVGFDGRATLNIVIRTLVRYGDEYHLRVGGGVVHDSIPEKEYEETLAKARALVNAVDAALDSGIELEVAEGR